MVHGELIAAGKAKQLTYRQIRSLERMDAKKEREKQLFEIAKAGVTAAGETARGIFQNQIAGTVAFALLMVGAYGWGPTRAIMINLSQGVAYGAALGWKNAVAPTLKDLPFVAPFFPGDNKNNPPDKPPANAAPVCSTQWTFLKYSPLYGWTRGWFNDVNQAIAKWDTYNLLDLVGNLVAVTTCTDYLGNITNSYFVTKYAPGHSDIDNPANNSFNVN
jgi:hypothetical protein